MRYGHSPDCREEENGVDGEEDLGAAFPSCSGSTCKFSVLDLGSHLQKFIMYESN